MIFTEAHILILGEHAEKLGVSHHEINELLGKKSIGIPWWGGLMTRELIALTATHYTAIFPGPKPDSVRLPPGRVFPILGFEDNLRKFLPITANLSPKA